MFAKPASAQQVGAVTSAVRQEETPHLWFRGWLATATTD